MKLNFNTVTEVLEHLEQCFMTDVEYMDSDKDVWIKFGQKQVMDKIKQLREENDNGIG